MYKCQVTGKFSKEGEKLNKVVVATRTVEYKHWDREAEEEWFSHGSEIVKEINASDEGARLWESWTPDQQAAFAKSLS
jgi:hypothetical protein